MPVKMKTIDGVYVEVRKLQRAVIIGDMSEYDKWFSKLEQAGYTIMFSANHIGASAKQFRLCGEKDVAE